MRPAALLLLILLLPTALPAAEPPRRTPDGYWRYGHRVYTAGGLIRVHPRVALMAGLDVDTRGMVPHMRTVPDRERWGASRLSLRELLRQTDHGMAGNESYNISSVIHSLAGLAFVGCGSTHRRGPHQAQVRV